MKGCLGAGQEGFSLLEVIATLTVAAVLGAMLYGYTGTSLTKSSLPLHRLKQALSLVNVMENIIHDYETDYDLTRIKTTVGSEGTQQTSVYGTYRVVKNRYIKFVSGAEHEITTGADPEEMLKVTIQNDMGQSLTTLFTAV